MSYSSTTTIKEREGEEPDHPIHRNLQSDGLHPASILNAFYALITHHAIYYPYKRKRGADPNNQVDKWMAHVYIAVEGLYLTFYFYPNTRLKW
uniref:Uncharacterized protein n=1 Tax=Triticum urartu TaxID=4572 RepID=A0A8R7UGW8_TRIUA